MDRDGDGVSDAVDCAPATADAFHPAPWHPDNDSDGFGAPEGAVIACQPPSGYVSGGTDCDDANPRARPGAVEVWYDGVDEDCAGGDDFDQDGDGYRSAADIDAHGHGGGDCDDGDPAIHPGAADAWYDGIDADCDGQDDYDQDGDGARSAIWPDVTGRVGDDCDDQDPAVYPGAPDHPYDGVDADCAGDSDADADGDGFAGLDGDTSEDCDDHNPAVHPGAAEDCATPWDDDCDGQVNDVDAVGCAPGYLDTDGDGYGVGESVCTCVGGARATVGGDCDDRSPTTFPGAVEVCNAVDDDCDGGVDEDLSRFVDQDGDGFGSGAPTCADGDVALVGDCDDSSATIYPGAPELCDGELNDCDLPEWGEANEAGLAAVVSSDGTWRDETAAFAPETSSYTFYRMPRDGTLYLCPGRWHAQLTVPDGSFDYRTTTTEAIGPWGPEDTVIDRQDGGPVVVAYTDIHLQGLTLEHSLGSVIDAEEDTVIDDCVIQYGNDYQGGGIDQRGGSLTLRDSVVRNNMASWTAGGISVTYASLRMERSVISNNLVSPGNHARGGGVYFAGGHPLVIQDSVFEGNTIATADGPASGGGLWAALYTSGGEIVNTRFEGNVVSGGGSAVGGGMALLAWYSPTGLSLENLTFSGNLVAGGVEARGGGLYFVKQGPREAFLRGFTFNGNETWGDALNEGGGAYVVVGNGLGAVRFEDAAFQDNAALDTTGASSPIGRGGGLYADVHGGSLTLSAADISGNDAGEGAGIDVYLWGSATLDLTHATWIAENVGDGLDVRTSGTATRVSLVDSVVSGNGGRGVYVHPSHGGATSVACVAAREPGSGIYGNGGAGIEGDYGEDAATGTITSTGCDFDDPTTGDSNAAADVWSGTGRYDFGRDATFTCAGNVCTEVTPP